MTQRPRDLGDGLTLRAATFADAGALATFNADVIRMQDMATPQANLGEWTRDPDCIVRGGESRALLNALFPRQPSIVWPIL